MIVGVTQRIDKIDSYNEVRDALDQRLVEWILKAGFIPVPIPNGLVNMESLESDQSFIFEWLTKMRIDVLLLSGGNDIGTVPKRDLLEKSLLFWAEKNKKPVLGLCRGMQLMGVYFGSELIDVKGHVRTEHQLQMNDNIEKMFPNVVNSYHNQALKDCPDEFKIIAKAKDGNIEAMSHKELPWEAWMWHPERESEFNIYSINRIKQLFNK
jgi:N5-(cytidine 5'-diphosphoramidyl)-L-glutamine hydrolase|tara:strand:+ start:3082 stop:3711 length:630 start_codon:yes stop_codon:yes gene_type:complete